MKIVGYNIAKCVQAKIDYVIRIIQQTQTKIQDENAIIMYADYKNPNLQVFLN